MKKYLSLSILILVLLAGIGIYGYMKVFGPLADKDFTITVFPDDSIQDIGQKLRKNAVYFDLNVYELLSSKMHFDTPEPGKYHFTRKESSLIHIIRSIRNGKQQEVSVVLHDEQRPREVAGKIARYLAFDSVYYAKAFSDPTLLMSLHLDSTTLMTHIIPNTYKMYWYTTAEEFLQRMKREHTKFWSQHNRKKKADSLGLDPYKVYTLASIVEKESRYKPERPRIAGVYLNRLEKGIALQADPTVLFAKGDFTRNRVLKNDLLYDSPYNTYLYPGLPPGPIGLASINSIDAVLNAEAHEYFYFCAKPDNSGQHVFARTLDAHIANARKFQRWLNKQDIYR